jgi:multiple sugar transport system substrate-binding protein
MNRRMLSLLVVTLLLTISVFGAGKQEKAGPANITTPVMTGWQCIKPALDRIKEFEGAHPSIKVTIVEFPYLELQDKIFTEAAMGSGTFDIAQLSIGWNSSLMASGKFVSLNKYIEKKYGSVENYTKKLFDVNRVCIDDKGNVQFMPFHANIRYGIYRDDLFKKYGLKPPKSYEDVVDAAKKLTRDTNSDGRIDLWGLTWAGNYEDSLGTYIDLATGMGMNGTELLDNQGRVRIGVKGSKDREAAVSAARYYQDATYKFKVTPPNIVEIGGTQQWEMWKAGLIGMSIDWWGDFWGHPDLRSYGDVGSFVQPALPDVKEYMTISWWSYGVFKSSSHPEQAFEFINWWLDEDIQAAMSKFSGQGSPVKEYTDKFAAKGYVAPALLPSFSVSSAGPQTPKWPQIAEAIRSQLSRLLTNEITPEQMVDILTAKYTEILK